MQWYEAALVKLGTANHQSIRSDVLIAQTDCFRNAKPRASEQCKEGAVGISAQTLVNRLERRLDEAFDIMLREYIRDRPTPMLTAKYRRRQFMTWLFSTGIACEPN